MISRSGPGRAKGTVLGSRVSKNLGIGRMGGACLGTGKQGWTILDFGNGEEEAEKVSRVALE